MRGWSCPEIARFLRREATFLQHGLSEREAELLAQQLLHRDRPEEDDDRRICWECRHFQPLRCTAGQPPMPFVLQRCPAFALKEKP